MAPFSPDRSTANTRKHPYKNCRPENFINTAQSSSQALLAPVNQQSSSASSPNTQISLASPFLVRFPIEPPLLAQIDQSVSFRHDPLPSRRGTRRPRIQLYKQRIFPPIGGRKGFRRACAIRRQLLWHQRQSCEGCSRERPHLCAGYRDGGSCLSSLLQHLRTYRPQPRLTLPIQPIRGLSKSRIRISTPATSSSLRLPFIPSNSASEAEAPTTKRQCRRD